MRFLPGHNPKFRLHLKNELILVTGASGKTGRTIMDALLSKGYAVKALIHSPIQAQSLDVRIDPIIGDMKSKEDMNRAMTAVTAVYHICPNMHPDEVAIGKYAIQAAKKNGVRHFVYHSVLHPQIKEMAHHWKKMQVEGLLFKTDMDFTILQPAAYLQNLLQYKSVILDQSMYAVPYNGETRVGMVDLRNVAEVAASIITNPRHFGSTYELATDECFNQYELAEKLSLICKRKISFKEIDRDQWEQAMRKSGMTSFAIACLNKMFQYYETYGLTGNGMVLKALLGRKPNSVDAFIKEFFTT
jgi:NAD(P)H dehydrogenase (quinone)